MTKEELAALRAQARQARVAAKIRARPKIHPLIRDYMLLRSGKFPLSTIANKSGFSIASLHNWERAGGNPRLITFDIILRCIGYRLEIVKND